MAGNGTEIRIAESSLFAAATHLESTLLGIGDGPQWPAPLHEAIRRCTVAVEARLQSLAGAAASGDGLGSIEPRLIGPLEALEAELARLLIELWEAKGAGALPGAGVRARLPGLVEELREAAATEFALEYEPFNVPGGET